MMGMTEKQDQLLGLIRSYQSARGIPPSRQEMCRLMGQRSKSGIQRLVNGLEERGLVRCIPNRARAIEIVTQDNRPPATVLSADQALAVILRAEQLQWLKQEASKARVSPAAFLRELIEDLRTI